MMNIYKRACHVVMALYLLSTALLVTAETTSSATAPSQAANIFFFETDVPSSFSVSHNAALKISGRHAKDGLKSLRWDFKQGATLSIAKPIGFETFDATGKSQLRHAFATWMYNVKPINADLLFQFHSKGDAKSSFTVNLNFKGWRAVVVPFEADMEGKPDPSMDRLTIKAPNTGGYGRLYFDQMALSVPVDPRWPTADYQVPYVNKAAETRPNAHWTALQMYDRWLREFTQSAAASATEQELAAIEKIAQRIDEDLLAGGKKTKNQRVKQLGKQFSRFVVRAEGDNKGKVLFRPLTMTRHIEFYRQAQLNKQQMQHIESSTVRFRNAGKYLLSVAKAYRMSEKSWQKEQLANLFLSLVNHIHEQGFVRGSGQGTMHHQGYVMKEWTRALFLMRDVLGEQRATAQQAIAWYTGAGRIFRPKEQIVGFNVDVMNTFLEAILYSALMEPNKNAQVAFLRAMSQWMSYSMVNIHGLAGGIQEDGSFFHHSQHYVAYGNGGLNGLTPVVYYLSRSPFALDIPAHQRLRKAVLMSRIFSNDQLIPMSLSGRHPNGRANISLTPFRYLTKTGTPGSASGYDKEIARAYLRLQKQASKSGLDHVLKNQGLTAEPNPTGSWVMNFSNMAIHRQADWLATARGFSRYLVGNESYGNANHFGRYINYGHLEITPANAENRGFSEQGWDWNRWPGTTTIQLPFEQLAAKLSQVDEFSGIEEMLLSDETYSGANQLNNDSAMFAMKLHGHPKYDGSFRARKSVFFFDDRIVALGTGITNNDTQHPTQTTLFQDHLNGQSAVTYLRERAQNKLEVDQSIVSDSGFYLLDTDNNAYYLPEGQKIRVLRQTQQSLTNNRKKPTQGNFATALIEHGKAPKQAGYEYAVLVAAGQKKARQFVAAMQNAQQAPYKVLQRDQSAHIVLDRVSNTTAYALFEAGDSIAHGVVKAVDTPSMLMVRTGKDQSLQIALTDPDLNLYQGIEQSQYLADGTQKEVSIYSRSWRYSDPKAKTVRLTLKGQWQAMYDSPHYTVVQSNSQQTVVDVICVAAKPVQMAFKLH